MSRHHHSTSRRISNLQCVLLTLALLVALIAADTTGTTATQAATTKTNEATTTQATTTQAEETTTAKTATTTADEATTTLPGLTTDATTSEKETTSEDSTSTSATSTSSTTKTTATATATATDSDLPSVTSDAEATTTDEDMPSLTQTSADGSSYTTPAITIPATNGNPYIHRTSSPRGTVFIAVGSVIGGIILSVLAWNAVVAFAMRRELKNSRGSSGMYDYKGLNDGVGNDDFYGHESVSMDNLTPSGTKLSMYSPLNVPGNTGSMFISPTAEVTTSAAAMTYGAGNTNSMMMSGNSASMSGDMRSSAYLPSGYYPSAGPAPSNADAPPRNSTYDMPVEPQRGRGRGSNIPPSMYLDEIFKQT